MTTFKLWLESIDMRSFKTFLAESQELEQAFFNTQWEGPVPSDPNEYLAFAQQYPKAQSEIVRDLVVQLGFAYQDNPSPSLLQYISKLKGVNVVGQVGQSMPFDGRRMEIEGQAWAWPGDAVQVIHPGLFYDFSFLGGGFGNNYLLTKVLVKRNH